MESSWLREWLCKRGGALVFYSLIIISMMGLYYISQDENTVENTYHAAIVAAKTAGDARNMHPGADWDRIDVWCCDAKSVKVIYIGKAKRGTVAGVILTSFS